MSDITPTAADVGVVKVIEMATGPPAETITVGQWVRLDTSSGKWTLGNGSGASEARSGGLVVAISGDGTLSVLRQGDADIGDALSSLAYDLPIYLSDTDGALGTAASDSAENKIVGTVVPRFTKELGSGGVADKLLRVAPIA